MRHDSWYILNSKYNYAYQYGLNPHTLPQLIQTITPEELRNKKEIFSELVHLTEFFAKKLFYFLNDIPAIVIITDDMCNVIKVMGNEVFQSKIGIKEGLSFNEKYAGPNSIFLCLNHNRPIQIRGNDHFHEALYNFSCSSCKFTLNNGITGTFTLMTTVENSSSFHLGLVSSAVDSIEREIEVKKKNKQLNLFNQIIISSTKNAIIITDKNGTITDFNEVAENYTGFNRLKIIGNKINILKECFNGFSHYVEKILLNNEKFENIEIHFYKNNKLFKVCLFDGYPIYDGEQLIGAFCQFRDITDRYELEQQVIANEKLSVIGKMGAGLAHEIRNPLTPISGFLHLLEKDVKNPKSKEYFTIINEELDRITELIHNFVTISKPEAPCKKEVCAQKLLVDTIHLMETHASKHNISIKYTDLIGEEFYIYIDKNQIKQVLINLIKNAIEAMDSSGEVNILLNKNSLENKIEILVIDQGSGIDQEILNNLFTPFLTTKATGTGLGLSVCNQIIQNHHGKIEVESIKEQGTIFKVILPILDNKNGDDQK